MRRFDFCVPCDGRVSPARSTVAAHGGGQSDGPVHAELDGDASDEDALSETSDRLVETRRSLNGLVFVRCVPVEMSPVLLVLSSGAPAVCVPVVLAQH